MPRSQHGGRLYRSLIGGVVCLLWLTACGPSAGHPKPAESVEHARSSTRQPAGGGAQQAPRPDRGPRVLSVDSFRQSAGVIASGGQDAVYNYAPTLMLEDGRVRMWWCSQYSGAAPPGDDILYAEAADINGPFSGPGGGPPIAVFSGNPGGFDAVHTCDPSVIRVNGTYYMYYTGAAGDRAHANAIGLATSPDGLHWERANGGRPIVGPAHDVHRANDYGAGQPSAVYLDGWFYLMFTDTTGAAADWNGAGQFVLRSRNPAFTSNVQAVGPGGFVPVPGTGTKRMRSVVNAFSADLMWVDALQAFAIAHETAKGTTITFWNRSFTEHPYRQVLIPGPWEEGPGLLRLPKGHAPVSKKDPCGRVPIDVVRATKIGQAGAPTALRHFGIDLYGIAGCATPERALAVLEGFAAPSPVRTMTLVTDNGLVRVQRRSVAEALAERVLDSRPSTLRQLKVRARIPAGAPLVRTAQGRVGFVLRGTLWPVRGVDARKLAELNGSPLRKISRSEWKEYPTATVLGS